MERLFDFSALDWITEVTDPAIPGAPPTVSRLIPQIFPAYAKVFHPIYEDPKIEDKQLTWHGEAKLSGLSNDQQSLDPLFETTLGASTLVYGGVTPGSRLLPVRWEELCLKLDIPYASTLSSFSFTRNFEGGSWPRYLVGPDEGSLAPLERDALISVLSRHTQVDRCFFHLWLLATIDIQEDLLFAGSLQEAGLFPDEASGARLTPTHWFPEDHSWLVCSDYDLTFTLVGGSELLIEDLLTNRSLECIRVYPETRVDAKADTRMAPLHS